MRVEVPEELRYYDPFKKEDYEKVLAHFKVKVWPDATHWGYSWKYGGVQMGIVDQYESEDQVRAIVALAVYLYAHGTPCHMDDRLAHAYIKQGWHLRS